MPRRGDRDAVTAHVAATPDAVLAVVRDVTRHAELSPEVTRVRWRGGPPVGVDRTGARFAGWSRTGVVHWVRTCEVVADRPGVFAWVTLPTWWNHDATLWCVATAPDGDGSRVTLSYEVLADAPWFIRVGGVVTGRVRRLPVNLRTTVAAIGALATAEPPRR